MFETLTDALREALTRRLDPGLAGDLALALESLEEYGRQMEAEHPAPSEPPRALDIDQTLAEAGIEPPAMHFGGSVPAEAITAPASRLPPAPARIVAGLRAKLAEDGTVRVEGKDAPGRAVARTVQDILAAVMHQRIGSPAEELLNLAVRVELLEKENANLRERLASLS